jgi:hypothetical protein
MIKMLLALGLAFVTLTTLSACVSPYSQEQLSTTSYNGVSSYNPWSTQFNDAYYTPIKMMR